ncbi:3-hydroxyacyl-CoA dehydrogenase NAD-binding domain-containing protein [Cognatishimia sp. WU-CL00825]|uniref:enoyl-CoA hydratase-related protein n=1 Tax=Cognatishimia sp. WU-CL00825 TaxID=3127658 RepID=UPI00310C2DCB
MTELVAFQSLGPVGQIAFSNGHVNTISKSLCVQLKEAIEIAAQDSAVSVILLAPSGPFFGYGLDVAWLQTEEPLIELSELCSALEACEKPVVAALQGTAFGAAAEIALACHYRLAAPDVRFGFPDVHIGIPPAGGATQRLPRLIGADLSLRLLLSGQATSAANLDTVFDAIIEGQFDDGAVRFAKALAEQGVGPNPTCDRQEGFGDPFEFQKQIAEMRAIAKDRGLVATSILQCVEAAALLPFSAGLNLEEENYLDCAKGELSRSLRHVQSVETRAGEVTGRFAKACRRIETVAVVGPGAQGVSLAVASVLSGMKVSYVALERAQIEPMQEATISALDQELVHRKLGQDVRNAALQGLNFTSDSQLCADADLVLITELQDRVHSLALFEAVGKRIPDNVVLASVSGMADVTACATASGRAEQCIGLLFPLPTQTKPIAELIVTDSSSSFAQAVGARFVQQLGKVAIKTKFVPGMVGGTLMTAYWQAADQLLRDGASFASIDAAMREYGFAMGPFQALDLGGIGDALALSQRVLEAHSVAPITVEILDLMTESGFVGRRNGAGFYQYEADNQAQPPHPDAIKIVHGLRAGRGESLSKSVIQMRCVGAMANAGAVLIANGFVETPSDIDAAAILGLGFPRAKGGPMFAADQFGVLRLRNALASCKGAGGFLAPSSIFETLIKNGEHFEDLNHWETT